MDSGTKYLNGRGAALYCGYSYDYFRKIAKQYRIPRCGVADKMFKVENLDLFMQDTEYFLRIASIQIKQEVKPITIRR